MKGNQITSQSSKQCRFNRQARAMGLKAREYALKLLHPEKIIEENIRFYEELLQS